MKIRTLLFLAIPCALAASACAEDPKHIAVGTLNAAGGNLGTWHAEEAKCDRGHQGDRAAKVSAETPVRLTFAHGYRDRDTVIEVPMEPHPNHVTVTFPGTSVVIGARHCEEFQATVGVMSMEGQPQDLARGSLRLKCPLPRNDGTIDVMVDFDQC